MVRRLDLPDAPGRADAEGLMHAPSAARNRDAILGMLLPALPARGAVLELASGTGEHVAAMAAARADLAFHPSDPDPTRRAAIDARCRGLPNVAAARDVDAARPGWAGDARAQAIVVVNLLHLLSDAELAILLDEAGRALAPGGLLAIYGPFLRDGRPVGEADRAFHADLQAQDPAIGLKEVEVVESVLGVLGLRAERVEMPARNLMLMARRMAAPGL